VTNDDWSDEEEASALDDCNTYNYYSNDAYWLTGWGRRARMILDYLYEHGVDIPQPDGWTE
jgi:hypothetical protein